ncbi:uncharacterized protein LOC141512596 isoform X2 [Macrotis lagotis]|uniref:uncharacterized protein LOC141512596 isoform X2 n=1 Tax=Macrotis lagotis TaxID=92651 RepID=UPI003D68E4FF
MSDLERREEHDKLLKIFKKSKMEIARAITTPFPFLEMLRDYSVISEQTYSECQGPDFTYKVIYNILTKLEKNFSDSIQEVLFHPINLQEYPPLVQIQKYFRDVSPNESASEASFGSPVCSLGDRIPSAVRTPQNSNQVPPNESASEASFGSPVWRSSLGERTSSAVRDPQSSAQVPAYELASRASVVSPLCRSSLGDRTSSAVRAPQSSDQVPPNESASQTRIKSPVSRSSLGDKIVSAVRVPQSSVQVPANELASRVSVGSLLCRNSLGDRISTAVKTPQSSNQVSSNESASENSLGSPFWRGSLGEGASSADRAPQSSVQATREIQDPMRNSHEFPVTCGKAKGILYKEKMSQSSSECIQMVDGSWVSLREFEIKGGRELAKNWKKSIYCKGKTLHTLIQENILPCPQSIYGKRKKILPADKTGNLPKFRKIIPQRQPPRAQRKRHLSLSQFPGKRRRKVDSLENRPKYEAQLRTRKWIHVACRRGTGCLYKKRFASLHKGKCILTKKIQCTPENRWCTPAEFLTIGSETTNSEITFWTRKIHSGGLLLQTLIEYDILKLHPDSCTCAICREEDAFPENSDECFVCADGGELLLCDSCPNSYHRNCHIPSIPEDKSQWNCTFCITEKNKEKGGPEKKPCQQESEVLKQRMYPEQQLKCEFLLMKTYCCRESIHFTKDPCYVERYYQYIKEPMWLDLVKERLSDETYNTVQGFVLDMRLIFSNCKKFNRSHSGPVTRYESG